MFSNHFTNVLKKYQKYFLQRYAVEILRHRSTLDEHPNKFYNASAPGDAKHWYLIQIRLIIPDLLLHVLGD